jgi:hypothetical protein
MKPGKRAWNQEALESYHEKYNYLYDKCKSKKKEENYISFPVTYNFDTEETDHFYKPVGANVKSHSSEGQAKPDPGNDWHETNSVYHFIPPPEGLTYYFKKLNPTERDHELSERVDVLKTPGKADSNRPGRGTAPKPPPGKSPILKKTNLDSSTSKKLPGNTKPEPTKPASNPKSVGFGKKNPLVRGQTLPTDPKEKSPQSKSLIKGLSQILAAGPGDKNSQSRSQTPTKTDPKTPTSTQNKTPTKQPTSTTPIKQPSNLQQTQKTPNKPTQKPKPATNTPDASKPKGPTLKKNPSALKMLADRGEDYNEIRIGLLGQTPDENIHGIDIKKVSSPTKSPSKDKGLPKDKSLPKDKTLTKDKTPQNDKIRRAGTMQPERTD